MLTKLPCSLTVALAALLLLNEPVLAVEFTVSEDDGGVTFLIDGELFTRYVINDTTSSKPYLYPLIGQTGKEMTRAYPMKDIEGEKQDHPHHRSLFYGHQSVNGFDTWHEKLTLEERAKGDEKKLAESMATLGGTTNTKVVEASANGETAVLKVTSDYVDASGNRIAEDERTFEFSVGKNGERILDIDIVFSAVADKVNFADAKDAGLSIRVAHSMSVDADEGGRIVLSTGEENKEAWGKRAEWCDFNGPVAGVKLGIAMLNHPSSLRHPTPWHARTYGLLTANPFGLTSVAGEKEDGAVVLMAGDKFTLRHRIILHAGDEKDADIAGAWKAYIAEK